MFTRPVSTFSLRSFMHRVWFAPDTPEKVMRGAKNVSALPGTSLGTHTLNR